MKVKASYGANEVPLPPEILDQILDLAARINYRPADCARFCLISKQFVSRLDPGL